MNSSEAANKEIELQTKAGELLKKYENIGLEKADLRFLFAQKCDLTDFACNVQITLCKIFNQKSYEIQVHEFINLNRSLIFNHLEKNGITISLELRESAELNIEIASALKGFATIHNKGKAPLIITLRSGDRALKFALNLEMHRTSL